LRFQPDFLLLDEPSCRSDEAVAARLRGELTALYDTNHA